MMCGPAIEILGTCNDCQFLKRGEPKCTHDMASGRPVPLLYKDSFYTPLWCPFLPIAIAKEVAELHLNRSCLEQEGYK